MTDPLILHAQAEYAARKWAVRLETRLFAGTFRMQTFADCIAYLRKQLPGQYPKDNWFCVTGPGGRLDADQLETLVQK